MEKKYVNDFVIEIASGHPGYTSYTIIATRENLGKLAADLGEALLLSDSEMAVSGNPSVYQGELVSRYATIAYGETSRVYLNFKLSADLAPYHVRKRNYPNFFVALGSLAMLFVLWLAYIGLRTVIHHFFRL
jgi:hypothetical protein